MADTTATANRDASARRLGPVSYVVLGFISYAGELSSYDLKQKVEHSVGYFWPFPHTQLYDEPKRLVEQGLLTERVEEGGRRRRAYSITRAGRDALREWLEDPATQPTRLQDPGLLQLFFSASAGDGSEAAQARVRALAREQVLVHSQRLADYERIEEQFRAVDGQVADHSRGACAAHARLRHPHGADDDRVLVRARIGSAALPVTGRPRARKTMRPATEFYGCSRRVVAMDFMSTKHEA